MNTEDKVIIDKLLDVLAKHSFEYSEIPCKTTRRFSLCALSKLGYGIIFNVPADNPEVFHAKIKRVADKFDVEKFVNDHIHGDDSEKDLYEDAKYIRAMYNSILSDMNKILGIA